MAKASDTQKDRPSGWPPEGTGRFRFVPLPSDDLVLAILWALVVLGLVIMAVFLLPALMGWSHTTGGVVAAYAQAPANVRTSPVRLAEQPAGPPSQQPHEKDISSEVEVSQGSVLEGTFHSDTLGMDLPYRIYLPPGYKSSQQRYPTLYMLHGLGGNYTEWTEGTAYLDFYSAAFARNR